MPLVIGIRYTNAYQLNFSCCFILQRESEPHTIINGEACTLLTDVLAFCFSQVGAGRKKKCFILK